MEYSSVGCEGQQENIDESSAMWIRHTGHSILKCTIFYLVRNRKKWYMESAGQPAQCGL
jgi:hypothetical protein